MPAVQVRSIYFLRRTSSCIPLWNGCRHEASGAFRRQKRKSLTSSVSSGKTASPYGWTSYETSVQDVVKQIMKESDNLNAEAMLCRLGVQSSGKKRVSAEDGLSAIRMLIKEMGYNPIGIIWQMVAVFPITTTFHRNSWFLSCDMPTRVRMFSRNFIRLCPLAAWTVHWSSA